ncbi:MAG: hypothetical protein NXY57DRAFT_560781 [Lentinula lateritia]|uniref:DUF6534 domain-containing protein n=1 Tax=Lentinula lateritia TaxID=40482 RepID=A0ABQ8VMT0_9AGAR|nr:MAG: hypothetical protein NXY57DRAFT_560781 [Lentinula lateritia]KAJ4496755.1 hypothetical protein C8R41DRAFT_825775 [Lentinula lateritia]
MSNTTSPPMAPFPSTGFDLSSIFDPFFYGVIISTGLFGISIVQLWTYINLSRDRWMFRVVVITVFFMDMATTYLDIGLLHNYLISHFGDLSIFSSYSNLLDMEILFTALIVFVVDLYFASRVYLLKQVHWSVVTFIVSTNVIALLLSILSVIISFHLAVFTRLGFTSKDNEIIVALENAMTTICEVVATTALAWSLHSSRTGVPRTDNILHKLHNYTITRGVLLTIVQILSLVFYVAQPTKLTWIAFHMCLSKLYFITMAAMLNTRSSLRRRLDRTITDSEVGRIIQQSGHDFARGTSFVLASNPDASALNDSNSLAEFGLTQISTPDTENPDDDHESVHSIKVPTALQPIVITRNRISTVDYHAPGKC